ncbi:MAG: Coenzyme F420 hydrogenase/dehydrogenase, beta subunit C-terminal domain [Pseudomonadota bacterium]
MSTKGDIGDVINNGFCIGCGSCQVGTSIGTVENAYGMFLPNTQKYNDLNSAACAFSNQSVNERAIGKELFSNASKAISHKYIGSYLGLYAGNILDSEKRLKATSGGITKWILSKLLEDRVVDAVIHVVRSDNDSLFIYDIAHSIDDVMNGSQSAYYTTNFSKVMNKLLDDTSDKTYAFVGVPCYCKSIRLLQKTNAHLKKKIKVVVGILCGHMKTKNYAKYMAWESGLKPDDITYVNFRKKNNTSASDYIFNATSKTNEVSIPRNKLHGGNYNIPHMKYKACDFCEDVFAYTADVVLGDAWLPKYVSDPNGTNVVIVRSKHVLELFQKYESELFLESLNEEEMLKSQGSSYSHRIEEIGFRLHIEEEKGNWYPDKTIKPTPNLKDKTRENIQRLRIEIREVTHEKFAEALESDNIDVYHKALRPMILKLNSFYRGNSNRIVGKIKKLVRKVLVKS